MLAELMGDVVQEKCRWAFSPGGHGEGGWVERSWLVRSPHDAHMLLLKEEPSVDNCLIWEFHNCFVQLMEERFVQVQILH